jgi:MraZ protein
VGGSGKKGAIVGILSQPYFRGQSTHRLDSKGRLRIPAKFRDILKEHYKDALVVTMMKDCLVAYPPETWELIEAKVLGFSQVDPQQRAFMRYFVSSAEVCEFDAQGRILIPPVLRERACPSQEVLLAGMLNSFEIWDRVAWDKHMQFNAEHSQQMMEGVAAIGL